MARYVWVRRSDPEAVKKAAERLRQFIFWGRTDQRIVAQVTKLQEDVAGLLKLVEAANADHRVTTAALDKISRLQLENAVLHGAALGGAVEIAAEAYRKTTA